MMMKVCYQVWVFLALYVCEQQRAVPQSEEVVPEPPSDEPVLPQRQLLLTLFGLCYSTYNAR